MAAPPRPRRFPLPWQVGVRVRVRVRVRIRVGIRDTVRARISIYDLGAVHPTHHMTRTRHVYIGTYIYSPARHMHIIHIDLGAVLPEAEDDADRGDARHAHYEDDAEDLEQHLLG